MLDMGLNRKGDEGSKSDNGFTLLEVIVVVAIMGILAGLVVPNVIRYIERSKKTSDEVSCAHCKTIVAIALADEEAYKDLVTLANRAGSGKKEVTIVFDGGKTPVITDGGLGKVDGGCFFNEVVWALGDDCPKTQSSGHSAGYKVTVEVESNEVKSIKASY